MPRFVSLLTSLTVFSANIMSYHVYGLDEGKAQQCVVDLCGPAKQYLPMRAEGPFSTVVPEDVKVVLKETESSLNQMIELSLKKIKLKDHMLNRMTNQDLKSLSKTQQSLVKFGIAASTLFPVLEKVIESDDGLKFKINLNKVKKELSSTDLEFLEVSVETLNIYLDDNMFKMIDFAGNTQLDLFLRETVSHFSPDYESGRQKLLTYFIDGLTQMRKQFGDFVIKKSAVETLYKLKEGKKLSDYEEKQAQSIISRFFAVSILLKNELQSTMSKLPISKEHLMKKKSLQKNRALLALSQSELQIEKSKVIGLCQRSIAQYFSAIPSELKIKKANEWMQKVKVASKKVAARYVDRLNLEEVNKGIDKLSLMKSNFVKDHEQVLKERFTKVLSEALTQVKMLEKANEKNDFWMALSEEIVGDEDISDSRSMLSDLNEFCDSLKPDILSDMAYSGIKEFRAGWQSVMFPEIGIGIMAHEIGHIISYYVSKNSNQNLYSRTKECSKQRHEKLLALEQDYAGLLHQYGEEDWADDFAAAVINELKSDLSFVENYTCALLEIDKKTQTYKHLRLIDLNGVDNHSTSFLRAIRTQVQIGLPLPTSCLSAMGHHVSQIVTKKCE